MRWAAWCLGVVVCAVLPFWSPWIMLAIIALACVLVWRYKSLKPLLWLLLGLVYGLWRFQAALDAQIPIDYSAEQQSVILTVSDVSSQNEQAQQFSAQVLTSSQQSFQVQAYDYQQRTWPVGSVWRCSARLRSNIGVFNDSGFNPEQWALANGIDGSVTLGKSCVSLGHTASPSIAINQVREHAWRRLQHLHSPHQQGVALIAALSIGLQAALNDDTWLAFRQLGIVHLISISGVHVTMLAVLVAWLIGQVLRILPVRTNTPVLWQIWGGVVVAFVYALLAGFQIPTQRTVWMLLVFACAFTWRRQQSLWQTWWQALALVLLWQPTAVLSVGLWLSFVLVAGMVWAEQSWRRLHHHVHTRWWRKASVLVAVRAQVAAFLLTLVLIGQLFHSVPWLSPLYNSVAIPWFSWVLTPLALLASVLPFDAPLLAVAALAQYSIDFSVWLAQYSPQLVLAQLPWYANVVALLAVAIMMLPHALGLRPWAGMVLLMVCVYRPPLLATGQVQVNVLDVGQGLSVLLQTRSHQMLFDTGRGNANSVVLPALQNLGLHEADALVLSHADADHDGAAASLLRQFRFRQIWTGQGKAYPHWATHDCRGEAWQWDGVWFEWLTLPRNEVAPTTNAQSCVLRVVTQGQAVLIPADTGKEEETALLQQYGEQLHSTVLLLGHHGSSGSNSSAWLNAVAPKLAIASSGFRNSYHHPTAAVQTRLRAHGIKLYRTDAQGSVALLLDTDLTVLPRTSTRFWWQRKPFSTIDEMGFTAQ